jgi:hypothetical protein
MNISLTNRTTTSIELVAPSFRESTDGHCFCAIFPDHYVYVYESYSSDFSYIKSEKLKGEAVDSYSTFGRVFSDEFTDSTQGRFEAKLAKVFVDMTTFTKEVQP